MAVKAPRLLLSAPASSSGKTTVVLALLELFHRMGLRPAACKCGPDYIDPMFHREVQGVHGYNLDLFFTGPEIVRAHLAHAAADAGVTLVEGAMGYYDGIGPEGRASAWEVAKATETPALLVVNISGDTVAPGIEAMARVVNSRPNHLIRGVILNNCSSELADTIAPEVARETGLHVYGHLPTLRDAMLPSRHLGLVTPGEITGIRDITRRLADAAAENLDIAGLLALADTASEIAESLPTVEPMYRGSDGAFRPRLAVARDRAFCFYYPENLELLERLGVELAFFSPLADTSLPAGIHGLYLGGGYPEVHAAALSQNHTMRASVRSVVSSGLPVWAECGGFLYLLEELEGTDGRRHPMAGALPGKGFRTDRLQRFGYVTIGTGKDTLFLSPGSTLRGHEFHYWDADHPGSDCVATKASNGREWPALVAGPNIFAGFPHCYLWSNPEAARRFALRLGGKTVG